MQEDSKNNEDNDEETDEILLESLLASHSHRLETITEDVEDGKDALQDAAMKFLSIVILFLVIFLYVLISWQRQQQHYQQQKYDYAQVQTEEVTSTFLRFRKDQTNQGY